MSLRRNKIRFAAAIDLIKCLEQINYQRLLLTCASTSESIYKYREFHPVLWKQYVLSGWLTEALSGRSAVLVSLSFRPSLMAYELAQFYEQLIHIGRFGSQELLPSDLQANLGFPDLLENIDKVYLTYSRRFALKKLLTYVLGPPRAI